MPGGAQGTADAPPPLTEDAAVSLRVTRSGADAAGAAAASDVQGGASAPPGAERTFGFRVGGGDCRPVCLRASVGEAILSAAAADASETRGKREPVSGGRRWGSAAGAFHSQRRSSGGDSSGSGGDDNASAGEGAAQGAAGAGGSLYQYRSRVKGAPPNVPSPKRGVASPARRGAPRHHAAQATTAPSAGRAAKRERRQAEIRGLVSAIISRIATERLVVVGVVAPTAPAAGAADE